MWTRAELKSRAKMCLSRYYWAAFAVSLIFAILSGFGGSNSNTQRVTSYLEQNTTSSQDDQSGLVIGELGGDGSLSGSTQSGLASGIELVPGLGDAYGPGAGNAGSMVASNLFYRLFAGAVAVIVIVSVVIGIFVQPLFEVGRNRFYLESRVTGQSAGVGKIFWGFSNGYLKIVGTQFLRSLITEGVVFLCMAPGLLTLAFNRLLVDWMGSAVLMACGVAMGTCISIYFQYCYLMVPYILSENPDMKAREALRLSKEMMDGQKWNAFVLGLSFLGWQILGTMLCGIGTFFVQPYVDATFAELYAVLRGPYSGRLNGFGGEPFVQNNARYGGQYVEPDSVRDVGGSGNYGGGYGAYGNGNMNNGHDQNNGTGYSYGQNQNSAPDSWSDVPQETYKYNGPEQTIDRSVSQQVAAEDRGTDVKKSEGGPGRGYYLNGKFYPYTDDEKSEQ